jgi:hypothetical protein
VGTAPEHTTGRRVTPSPRCVQAPAKPSQPSTLRIFVITHQLGAYAGLLSGLSRALDWPACGPSPRSSAALPRLLEHAKSFLASFPHRGSLSSACILCSFESEAVLLLPCAQSVGVEPLTGTPAACQRAYAYLTCTQDCLAALACASLPRRAVGCMRGEACGVLPKRYRCGCGCNIGIIIFVCFELWKVCRRHVKKSRYSNVRTVTGHLFAIKLRICHCHSTTR